MRCFVCLAEDTMMDTTEVTLTIGIKEIAYALVSAFGPGGIRYWCGELTFVGDEGRVRGDMPKDWDLGFDAWVGATGNGTDHLVLAEVDDGQEIATHVLTHTKIRDGLAKLATAYPYRFAAILACNADAYDADVFVQMCIFGELKYG